MIGMQLIIRFSECGKKVREILFAKKSPRVVILLYTSHHTLITQCKLQTANCNIKLTLTIIPYNYQQYLQ